MIKHLFFFLLIIPPIYGQTIKGKITENNEPIPFANILIKNLENSIIEYQITNNSGNYSISLKKPVPSIIIEVNSFLFESQRKIINTKNSSEIIIADFTLLAKITSLKEVIINKKISPIKVQNDTTTYNAENFKDGTERVVEDLIKKLPGIKVEENGIIKFNGKRIKKMLLDGDDLFDDLYVTGSRNMNIELLDKVEAIENYIENSLLKGIKDSDDVILNLKLKKGKADFSGNTNLGVGMGYEDRYNLSVTGILINSKVKSFGLSSFNNIGLNNTPYEFQSNKLPIDSPSDKNLIAKQNINQGNFYSELDPKFHRINNTFFSSFNTLFKLSKKITLKSNIDYYNDKLSRINVDDVKFSSDIKKFDYIQTENIIKSPRMISGGFQVINKTSDNLNWEYIGKLSFLETNFTSSSSNNTLLQNNKMLSTTFFTKHNFNLTKRLKENSAFTTSILISSSNSPQVYNVSPGTNIGENSDNIILLNNQNSRFEKKNIDAKIEYLSAFSYFKSSIVAGYFLSNNDLNSSLSTIYNNNEIFSSPNFQNDLKYNVDFPYIDGNLAYKKAKFGVKVGLKIKDYKINMIDKIRSSNSYENNLIVSPQIKFVYKLSEKHTILSGYTFSQTEQNELNLFKGIIQKGFRNFQNNEPSLDFLKTHIFSIGFNYNDLFNLSRASIYLLYNRNYNNYFTKFLINANSITTNSFLLNSGNSDYNLNASGEKYIPFIKTTLQFNTNYSISFNKNILNNSDLRDIENRIFQIELTAKRGGKSKLQIENILFYSNNYFIIKNATENRFSALKNSFRTVYKLKDNFKITSTVNYIIADLSTKNKYYFIDSEILFTSKNKKIDYSIIGRNLTNNKTFTTTNVSDYSITRSSHDLINIFIVGNISFKF